MNDALAERADFPVIGRFFQEQWAAYVVSYGGLLLDLLAVPLLLWRRTRIAAFCVTLAFHLINARLFSIGVFPWLAIAATSLFLSPDWPRYVFAIVARRPLTALALPGGRHVDVRRTFFSWRMKLVSHDAHARFFVTDPNVAVTREVDPLKYLSPRQTSKMAARPDMILQFAHYLARIEPCAGLRPLQVRAQVLLSLNGREPAPLIDASVDLAKERATLGHARWILPMPQPTPNR
jgi:vitamin K-dependent gamma-carboxylase